MSTVKHRFYGTWSALPLLVVLLPFSEISTASSYLQELENEAAASASGSQSETPAEKPEKPEWTPSQTILKENIDPGLNKKQFEEALKSRFYGSFLFYSSLSTHKQQQVYKEYLANNEIEHLREIIKIQMTN